MLLIKESDLILCSLNHMIEKLDFIILKTLERLSICLFKDTFGLPIILKTSSKSVLSNVFFDM